MVVHPNILADQADNYSCWWIYGADTTIRYFISHNMGQGGLFEYFYIIRHPWTSNFSALDSDISVQGNVYLTSSFSNQLSHN